DAQLAQGDQAPKQELEQARDRLHQLRAKIEGNDRLEQLLDDVLADTEKAAAFAKQMGGDSPAPGAAPPHGTPSAPMASAPLQAGSTEGMEDKLDRARRAACDMTPSTKQVETQTVSAITSPPSAEPEHTPTVPIDELASSSTSPLPAPGLETLI